MYKQLHDWMVCGHLNDKYEEFFISIDDKKQVETQLANQLAQQSMMDSIMAEDARPNLNELEEIFSGLNIFCQIYRILSFIMIPLINSIDTDTNFW